MEMLTRILPRSGSISVDGAALVLEGAVGDLDDFADAELDLRLGLFLGAADLGEHGLDFGMAHGDGRSLLPAKPMTPVVSRMKYQVRSTGC